MNRDSQNQSKQQTTDKQKVAEVQIDRMDRGDRDSGRPKRLAASTARDRIREQLSYEQKSLRRECRGSREFNAELLIC